MKTEITIIVLLGYGAFWRRFFDNTASVILKLVRDKQRRSDVNITVKTIYTKRRRKVQEKIKDTIKTLNPKKVVFIGKSLGGTEIFKFLRDEWDGILKDIEYNILWIDCHGAIAGDGKFGTYCDRQPMDIENKWVKPGRIVRNVRQKEDRFTGCVILINGVARLGTRLKQICVKGFTHYNIINSVWVRIFFETCIDNLLDIPG